MLQKAGQVHDAGGHQDDQDRDPENGEPIRIPCEFHDALHATAVPKPLPKRYGGLIAGFLTVKSEDDDRLSGECALVSAV